MSIALMSAAWRIQNMAPTEKLVLLALCDWANDEGESLHPSMRAIATKASLSERQAQRVVHSLVSGGWIQVIGNASGGAPGSTRQYRLNVGKITSTGDTGVRGDKLSRVTPVTPTGDMDDARRVTPVTPTGDMGVTQTTIEPSIEPPRTTNARGARAQVARPEGVTELVWTDFLALRRAKRAPLTATALGAIEREAAKAGLSLPAALALCCERGWQALRAEWLTQPARASPNPSRHAATIAALTGRSAQHPEDCIDVESRTVSSTATAIAARSG